MLDDDDLEFTALAWPAGGLVITLLGLILLVLVWVAVSKNKDECAQQHCRTGSPVLMHHECLCVERPEGK
jgi:hypothetical protein